MYARRAKVPQVVQPYIMHTTTVIWEGRVKPFPAKLAIVGIVTVLRTPHT